MDTRQQKGQVLRIVKSFTRPGVEYEIRQGRNGKVYCTCPAWRFGKGRACKHMIAALVGA